MRQKGDLLGPPPVVTTCRSGLAVRTGLASLAGPFLVKHHGRFFDDGRGGPARLQRVGAVGRAAGADAARETPAQVAGRHRRGGAEAQVRAVGPRRRGNDAMSHWVRAPGRRSRTLLRRCVGGLTSCCSLRRGAGHGWRFSTTCRGWRSSGRRPAGDSKKQTK